MTLFDCAKKMRNLGYEVQEYWYGVKAILPKHESSAFGS